MICILQSWNDVSEMSAAPIPYGLILPRSAWVRYFVPDVAGMLGIPTNDASSFTIFRGAVTCFMVMALLYETSAWMPIV